MSVQVTLKSQYNGTKHCFKNWKKLKYKEKKPLNQQVNTKAIKKHGGKLVTLAVYDTRIGKSFVGRLHDHIGMKPYVFFLPK